MSEPTTIAEWVERAGERGVPTAEDIAARQSTADLFRAHAECVRRLSEPMTIYQLGRWSDALDAVCEALGKRVDGAHARMDNLAHAMRGLDEKARMALYAVGINPGIGDP